MVLILSSHMWISNLTTEDGVKLNTSLLCLVRIEAFLASSKPPFHDCITSTAYHSVRTVKSDDGGLILEAKLGINIPI